MQAKEASRKQGWISLTQETWYCISLQRKLLRPRSLHLRKCFQVLNFKATSLAWRRPAHSMHTLDLDTRPASILFFSSKTIVQFSTGRSGVDVGSCSSFLLDLLLFYGGRNSNRNISREAVRPLGVGRTRTSIPNTTPVFANEVEP